MVDGLLIIEFSRWANAIITVFATQGGPSDDLMVVQLFLGISGVKILQVLAARICTMKCESRLVLNSCESCARASGISGTSLPDPEGACSFSNSTSAFALSGSSLNGSIILLLSISCADWMVNVLGPWNGWVRFDTSLISCWVVAFCRRLRMVKMTVRVASRKRIEAAPILVPMATLRRRWLRFSVADGIVTISAGTPSLNWHWETEKLERS